MNKLTLAPASNRETFSQSFEALDEDDAAIDLTDATIICEMREPGCTATTSLNVDIDTTVVTISLTETQTRSLKTVEYDIGCTINQGGTITQWFIGTLPVVDGVVR